MTFTKCMTWEYVCGNGKFPNKGIQTYIPVQFHDKLADKHSYGGKSNSVRSEFSVNRMSFKIKSTLVCVCVCWPPVLICRQPNKCVLFYILLWSLVSKLLCYVSIPKPLAMPILFLNCVFCIFSHANVEIVPSSNLKIRKQLAHQRTEKKEKKNRANEKKTNIMHKQQTYAYIHRKYSRYRFGSMMVRWQRPPTFQLPLGIFLLKRHFRFVCWLCTHIKWVTF